MTSQAQRYRHRIEIQEQTETQDSTTGAISLSWSTVSLSGGALLDSVPAEVLTGPGREFGIANAKQAECAARINMPWFPGLTQKMRVVWEGANYDIISIEVDATARREYRLKVAAGVNEG